MAEFSPAAKRTVRYASQNPESDAPRPAGRTWPYIERQRNHKERQ